MQGEGFRGKNTSKRAYFYGYKLALLISEAGQPVELAFIPGSYGEQSALTRLDFELPTGSIVWQNNNFIDYGWKDFYSRHEGIEFATQRKKNSLSEDTFIEAVAKKQNRKQIETRISEITARFSKKIHAVIIEGFQFKVFLTLMPFCMIKYISSKLN